MSKMFGGYDIEDIDTIANVLLQALDDTQEPHTDLKVLALCRAITLIGNEADLDRACMMIDEMADYGLAEALELMEPDFMEPDDDLPVDHIPIEYVLELDDDEGDEDADDD